MTEDRSDLGDGLSEVRLVEDDSGSRNSDTVAKSIVSEVEVDEGGYTVVDIEQAGSEGAANEIAEEGDGSNY